MVGLLVLKPSEVEGIYVAAQDYIRDGCDFGDIRRVGRSFVVRRRKVDVDESEGCVVVEYIDGCEFGHLV